MKEAKIINVFDISKSIHNSALAEKLLYTQIKGQEDAWHEQLQLFYDVTENHLHELIGTSFEKTHDICKKIINGIYALDSFFEIYLSIHENQLEKYTIETIHRFQDELRDFIRQKIVINNPLAEHFKSLLDTTTDKKHQVSLQKWLKDIFGSSNTLEKQKINFKLSKQLTQFNRQFEENNEKAAWKNKYALFIPLNKKNTLEGLSVSTLEAGKSNAEITGKKGWLFYLEDTTSACLLVEAQNRNLRKKVYETYQALNSDKCIMMDNDAILRQILSTKQKIAKNNGKKNYSELILSNYVLNTTQKAYDYLDNMQRELTPLVSKIRENMLSYAAKDQINELKPWDLPFYYEQVKKQYRFSKKDIFLEYFSWEDVLKKLIKFLSRQLDVNFTLIKHPLANAENGLVCYKVKDRRSERHGYFLISPFHHDKKFCPLQIEMQACEKNIVTNRQGVNSDKYTASVQYVSLTMEFNTKRQAMTMDDLSTLLHELGHAIYHFFQPIEGHASSMSWDLMELPSQFLEHLIYDKNFIHYLSSHYKTRKKLPENLLQEMIEKENFFKGYEIYKEIQKYKAHLWLHENFKPYSNKNPHKIVEERLAMEGIIYNIARDQFMLSADHYYDYAPAGYVYLYSAQLAFQIFEFYVDNEAYFQPHALRNIFSEIFHHNKDSHIKIHLEKFVDLFNVNMMKFLKKTWNIDLYGTTLWKNKQNNLEKIILKEPVINNVI